MSAPMFDPAAPSWSRESLLADLDRRFRLPLLAYFSRRASSSAEAEDLTQDVFERVLKSVRSRPVENPEALVFHIAVNLLRDRARRARRHGVEETLPAEAVTEVSDAFTVDLSPERVVLGELALAEVLAALEKLSPRTREMFYLYRLENRKIREIAELYGISPSAVEKQVARALVQLTRGLRRT
jgi:RNA polymerase sigma factor (sigma-70 family)